MLDEMKDMKIEYMIFYVQEHIFLCAILSRAFTHAYFDKKKVTTYWSLLLTAAVRHTKDQEIVEFWEVDPVRQHQKCSTYLIAAASCV